MFGCLHVIGWRENSGKRTGDSEGTERTEPVDKKPSHKKVRRCMRHSGK